MRIGILEDDTDQAAILTTWLEDADYQCWNYQNGYDFIRAIQTTGFDLLLLDWDVPEMNGIEVLRWVRRNIDWSIPVLFLTALNAEENTVQALTEGADDYIVKPPKRLELLARVNSVARRSGLTDGPADVIDEPPYRFDRKLRECHFNGEPVSMTKREFELACFLFENIGKILSREYLLQQVWSMNATVHTRTVDTHISRIRSKLNLRPESGWRLSSVYHYGYRLEKTG